MTSTQLSIATTVGALVILFLQVAMTQAASGWTPVDCADRAAELGQLYREFSGKSNQTVWAEHLRELEAAKEGDRLYTPVPFPKTEADIIRNFRYAYFDRFFDDPTEVDEEEWPIYSGLKGSELRLEVIRVENWRAARCSSVLPAPYYDVVRIYDERQELARFAMHRTGIAATYFHVTPMARDSLPLLDRATEVVSEALALDHLPDAAKYVAVDGLVPPCDPLLPCVALRGTAETYIWNPLGEVVYAITSDSPRRSITARRNEAIATGSLSMLGDEQPGAEFVWITAGFEWVEAQRVGPKP